MKKFEDILMQEGSSNIAFLLTGLEANFVLFMLDIILDGKDQIKEFPPGCLEILEDAREKVCKQISGHQFIQWKKFKDYSALEGAPIVTGEEMKKLVESIYNGGASPSEEGRE